MKRRIFVLTSAFFMLLILIQHHYVMMYFDDYGYASLSYGWTENKAGMSYTLQDMAKFLAWHYMNWGGRIVYYFFESGIFRIGGAEFMQAVQALIVIMLAIVSGKIVAACAKCDAYMGIALLFILYGTMHIQTLRDGVYWYSASVGYVWPLLPLLGSMCLLSHMQESETALQKGMAVFLLFLAAFSQEQTAVLSVVWIAGIACCQYFFGKKNKNGKREVPRYLVLMVMSAILGSMLSVLAPGNFARAGDERYADFYSKSLMERIAENTGIILDINIGAYNWVFVVIFTVFCGTAAALYFKNRSIYVAVFLFSGYFFAERLCSVPDLVSVFVRIVWAVSFAAVLAAYYYKQEKYLFLSMLAAGIASQGMMVISPSISMRCHTMMELLMHLIVAECIASTLKMLKGKKKYMLFYRGLLMLTAVYAIGNFCTVISGYQKNYEINEINHYKLAEMQKKWKAGKEEKEVLLYKLYDDTYANCMPYHPGFDFIEVWMKKYYELPNEVVFSWIDIEDDPDLRLISGEWYKDHWLGKEAVFVVQAQESKVLKLTVTNPQEIENQQIRCGLAGEENVYDFAAGETKVIELFIPVGKQEFCVASSQTFVPDNGDTRELSVVFDLSWK